jgi:hypothetical protein
MLSNVISSIGLLIDIAGVVLLFIYGLPSKIATPPTLLIAGNISDSSKKKNKLITRMSYVGLSLLIIGFILQLAGVWINQ